MPQPGTRRTARAPTPAAGGPARPPRSPAGRLRAAIADTLDLPADLVYDLPRITVLGSVQCTIENHRGLVEFRPTRVAVATRAGRVVVVGEDLAVGVAREGEVTVVGRLRQVRLHEPSPARTPGPSRQP